jgi:hypothetical protein
MNTTSTTQLPPGLALWSDSLRGFDPNPWNWEINEESTPTAERGCVPSDKSLAARVAPECVD